MATASPIVIRQLGLQDYTEIFLLMKAFTDRRDNLTRDEIWFVEHNPVFTQGQAGKDEYILVPGDIPVLKSDRGGHVTYHGPGQITAYLLIDLKRLNIGVRGLVSVIEKALVDTLACWQVTAAPRSDAPGVYVTNGKKIASLGLRIRKGCSYHGLNFNVDMDMSPWQRINPCGLGVEMTQLADLVNPAPALDQVMRKLTSHLIAGLGYNDSELMTEKLILTDGY
ncbi:MAG: lipoyl(octanoyl) transferase [Porticoccaceae bacterium]|jgi:lipoyl(octanoyl) transferase|tara:strand:+ start:9342 stop:10013 length:672 start_codon:yes stop_codon:yes gene_type:complete